MAAICESLVMEESEYEDIVSPSAAKKQRCEERSSSEIETDPRSVIETYIYGSDSDVEEESDGMHEMTPKEYEVYDRVLTESEGYDCMYFPKSYSFGKVEPIRSLDHCATANKLKTLSELALKEFYEKEGKKLKFVKVVKANGEPCAGITYYITFDVKEVDVVDGPTIEFQAQVWDGIHKTEVIECMPKFGSLSRGD